MSLGTFGVRFETETNFFVDLDMVEKRPTEMIKALETRLGEEEEEAKGNLIINVNHVTGCYLQGR